MPRVRRVPLRCGTGGYMAASLFAKAAHTCAHRLYPLFAAGLFHLACNVCEHPREQDIHINFFQLQGHLFLLVHSASSLRINHPVGRPTSGTSRRAHRLPLQAPPAGHIHPDGA